MDQYLEKKVADLRAALDARGASAVWIRAGRNVSWLMGGRPHIGMFTSEAAASLVLSGRRLHLVVDNVEKERLMSEEFQPDGIDIVETDWYRKPEEGSMLKDLFGSDLAQDDAYEDEFRRLRMNLDEREMDAMRKLGAAAGSCVEEACYLARPGMTEHKIASLMAGAAVARGLEVNVLLVAADGRMSRYRHPLPTEKKVEKAAMLSIVCRKSGLHAGLTRFVSFCVPDEGLLSRQRALNAIFARAVTRTRPGADIKDVFSGIVDDYDAAGFPGEWRSHHQGGVTGYSARELKAMPGLSFVVKYGQAYAWNPTVPGFKVEDTYLVGMHSNELVTSTPNLPQILVEAGDGDVVISDVLYRA
ncbi:MAG TPA: M24 family metallopeptidase [Bacillota bacterium]|nr:M24 family metallopeptidase [Bacillota bacterium]HOA14731.1 M24 family metallopeptidase [Bacillota bacterium]